MRATLIRVHWIWIFCIIAIGSVSLDAQTIYWKKDYIRDPSGSVVAVATPAPTDGSAPSAPTGLSSIGTTTTTVSLIWTASASGDTVGYVVYRGPIPVAAVSGTGFTDVGLLPSTSHTYKVVAFDASHNYSSDSSTLTPTTGSATNSPTVLTASMYSSSQINLAWSAPSSGAPHHYGIWRKSGGSWSKIDTTTSTTYADTSSVTSGNAYLYKVSAENSGDTVLGYTNSDLTITISFTDDPLTTTTLVKAIHINDLRDAVNAVRAAAGLSAVTWTDNSLSTGSSGTVIKAVHIIELRSNLAEATNLLGLRAAFYTDSVLTGIGIKKAHIEQLRLAME